jgi:hypothetical protein
MAIRHAGSRSHYEHNYRAFGNEVLRSGFMREQMESRAHVIMLTARRFSPFETGRYIESFEVTSGVTQTGRTRRAYGRVTNTAPHAMAVEFGWRNTPRYRPLGRAIGIIPGTPAAGA